ncbi:MAG: molybdopterin-dependent oxidoreductase [Candidatus Lokiarchaeota archaeon]
MKQNFNNNKKARLPPGQHLTKRFPVLQKGRVAHVDRENYNLIITGNVSNPKKFSLEDLNQLEDQEVIIDIHCVTSWSKFDTTWKGISFKKIFKIVDPKPTAKYVEFECADDGFTTTVPIQELNKENCLLATKYEGQSLDDKHGGPIRALIPHLYFYKSAKWVKQINFLIEDRLGYWERGGYSNKADPWKEQRYRYHD